ncbi:hypothetical protein [Selenomonas sp. AB3002]|uniref:hypothetical protein n=1 Tax=Selenomonas sp. AB3002 TaxID=1392502 RepID=UPI000498681B
MKYIDEQEKMELGRHLADYLIESGCATPEAIERARISPARTLLMETIPHQPITMTRARIPVLWCTASDAEVHGTCTSSLG